MVSHCESSHLRLSHERTVYCTKSIGLFDETQVPDFRELNANDGTFSAPVGIRTMGVLFTKIETSKCAILGHSVNNILKDSSYQTLVDESQSCRLRTKIRRQTMLLPK